MSASSAVTFSHIFKLLWLGWLAYWLISAPGNKKTAYRPGRHGHFLGVVLFIVLFAFTCATVQSWNRPVIPESTAMKALGLVLCATGLAFTVWARRALGRNWSANPVIKEEHELIRSGPYHYVRHPIYSGLLLAILGTALADGRLGAIIMFVGLSLGLHLKAKVEESLMLRQFPDTYPAYQRSTKSIIPFVL